MPVGRRRCLPQGCLPSTGFVDLRARQLDPTLGRVLSADTVQPNAPGTQGYNLYAYVANNPTTWTDLSGNSVSDAFGVAVLLGRACLFFSWCRGPLADGVRRIAVRSNAGDWRIVAGGFSESAFAIVACALDGACWNVALMLNDLLPRYGGGVDTGAGHRMIGVLISSRSEPLVPITPLLGLSVSALSTCRCCAPRVPVTRRGGFYR